MMTFDDPGGARYCARDGCRRTATRVTYPGQRFTCDEHVPQAWADLLEVLPTITQGQHANLKVDTGQLRVWLARTTVADGEPFARTVYVETLRDGRWTDLGHYDGDHDGSQAWPTEARDAWQASVELSEQHADEKLRRPFEADAASFCRDYLPAEYDGGTVIFDHALRNVDELNAAVVTLALSYGWDDEEASAADEEGTLGDRFPEDPERLGWWADEATEYLQELLPDGWWIGDDGDAGAYGIWRLDADERAEVAE